MDYYSTPINHENMGVVDWIRLYNAEDLEIPRRGKMSDKLYKAVLRNNFTKATSRRCLGEEQLLKRIKINEGRKSVFENVTRFNETEDIVMGLAPKCCPNCGPQ